MALRWAVEFRSPSWLCDEVYNVLERYKAALCVHDMIKNHPRILTAEWTYLRYHGERYSGSYSRQKLAAEADGFDGSSPPARTCSSTSTTTLKDSR